MPDSGSVTYRERPAAVPGAVLWERVATGVPRASRILPDGCLDLIWDGQRLFVAGPDSAARMHTGPGLPTVGLRFGWGVGPVLLGVPADELVDRTPDLAQLWPAKRARVLTERIADDPAGVIESWARRQLASCDLDPLGGRVFGMADAGLPVAVMADRLGLSPRQFHRRCLPVFGYGPRRLARVLRLLRAVDRAGTGTPLATVAADCGYADQAHLSREMRALAGTTPTELLRERLLGG
ncbi:MAG TPA: AraC family transcriptional regulator [Pseudonocardiaceae bacterium]|nr:AraC family transcriptional regulator [Pseudonocardiaceae bacterium]